MKKLLSLIAVFALVLAPVVMVSVSAQDDDYSELFDYDYDTTSDTDADGGVLAGFGLVTCCLVLIPLAIWAAISYFVVYKDAVKSGVDNPTLWLAVTFFLGVLGLLLYFLVGKKNAKAA